MKRARRILAAAVALCMMVGVIVWTDGAGEVRAEVSGDYEYVVLYDGTIEITKYNGSDEIVEIPREIDEKRVTGIGYSAFSHCEELVEVTIPDGVLVIGPWGFKDCTNLTKIDIPGSVTSIDVEAFASCTKLAEISIPKNVTNIRKSAFEQCSGLKDVYYSGTEEQWNKINIETIGNDELLNATKHFNMVNEPEKEYKYKDLGDGAIEITKYTGTGTVVEIPAEIGGGRVTSIGDSAFHRCETLTKVSIPDGVTRIGHYAFEDCSNLSEISISDSVSDIGVLAFGYCSSLKEMNIPASVTTIQVRTFDKCSSLVKINIPEGVTEIESNAFSECTSLATVSIPDSVTDIGTEAFKGCESLTKVNIPSSMASIKRSTFDSCTGLTEISIPDRVISIEQKAFYQCSNLENVHYSGTKSQWDNIEIVSEGNEKLLNARIHFVYDSDLGLDLTGDYVYRRLNNGTAIIYGYKGSEEVVRIPAELEGKRVVGIKADAFEHNNSLREVTIPAGVVNLNADPAVGGIDVSYANIFSDCPNLEAIYVDDENEKYKSIGGILFNKEKTSLVRCPEGRGGAYAILPEVVDIGEYAFYGCKNLTDVTVPDGVEEIGYGAFWKCAGITKLTLPKSVKVIGSDAFASCEKLKTVNIPVGITIINKDTFIDCKSLTEVEIPEGVTQIGASAFVGCESLKSIIIPVSVTKVSNDAFSSVNDLSRDDICQLEDVYYGGSKEQWEQIAVFAVLGVVGDGSVCEKLHINATIHFKEDTLPLTPEETILPETVDAKQELAKLKAGDPFSLNQDFQHYLSEEQIDVIETCLYTWLAEINYAYKYSGSSGIKERIMKKAGIDPQGDFASGTEQAITHISVRTPYGPKTFEVTLDLGKPDDGGSLYPAYGTMHYEVLEKDGIPSDVPTGGQIGRSSYTDMGTFIGCVSKSAGDSLRSVYQWEYLSDGMAAGILVDKTVTEIIGIKNGFFSDGSFIVYAQPLFKYSKRVKVAGPVNIYVYRMDGSEAGAVVDSGLNTGKVSARIKAADGNNKAAVVDPNVRFDAKGNETTIFLTGNDYYLNLRGTDTGKLKYEVEEIANDDVQRRVQFLEMQLEKDIQYEGYVFRPLNIERDLYALWTVSGSGQEVIYPKGEKQYQTLSLFKRIWDLSLSQKSTSLYANRTVQLDASLAPLDASNQNLQWTTDNGAVAKVDGSGLVTAVGSGRATVTVSTKDGSFLKQFCVIDVADRGSTGGTLGGSSPGGWPGGTAPSTEQGTPVVVNLHYVLQFNINGGTSLSRKTMTLLADDSPGIMPKAKRKGYVFNGWYTQLDGGTKVTGDKPLKEATTLYAQWTKTTAPAKVAAPTLQSKKKGQIRVSFQNVSGAAGYQAQYSTGKDFKSAKTKEAGASSKVKTLTGLKAGKKYYVRVRAYTVDSMKNRIYGSYSVVKSVKVKG